MDKVNPNEHNHSNQNLVEESGAKEEVGEEEGDFVETAETRILRFLKDCFNLRVHIANGNCQVFIFYFHLQLSAFFL